MKYKLRKKVKSQKYKGFTLIELLVVIAIISILSAVVMVSLSGIQKKARGQQIQSDVATMMANYDTYKSSHFGLASSSSTLVTRKITNNGGASYSETDWTPFWTTDTIKLNAAPEPPAASSGTTYFLKTKGNNYIICATGGDLTKVITKTYWVAKGGQLFASDSCDPS